MNYCDSGLSRSTSILRYTARFYLLFSILIRLFHSSLVMPASFPTHVFCTLCLGVSYLAVISDGEARSASCCVHSLIMLYSSCVSIDASSDSRTSKPFANMYSNETRSRLTSRSHTSNSHRSFCHSNGGFFRCTHESCTPSRKYGRRGLFPLSVFIFFSIVVHSPELLFFFFPCRSFLFCHLLAFRLQNLNFALYFLRRLSLLPFYVSVSMYACHF